MPPGLKKNKLCCHQDRRKSKCIMDKPGSLRVLQDSTGDRELVFQEEPGKPLPEGQRVHIDEAGHRARCA